MDMTVFGVYDTSVIPMDGEFRPFKSAASSDASTQRVFDPFLLPLFLLASLLVFWG